MPNKNNKKLYQNLIKTYIILFLKEIVNDANVKVTGLSNRLFQIEYWETVIRWPGYKF